MKMRMLVLLALPALLAACAENTAEKPAVPAEKAVSIPVREEAAVESSEPERPYAPRPSITPFPEVGLFNAKRDGKWVYQDEAGNIVLRTEFERAESFFEGRAAVVVEGEWGFIDETGRLVIPAEYEWAMYFSEGLAPVKKNGKWGYIDRSGTMVIEFRFDMANDFAGGYAEIETDGKRGYIDRFGNPAR